jgi:hypothetical protein
MLRLSGLGLLLACASVMAAPVDSVRVILPRQATPSMQNTARILERQVAQRCGAKITFSGESALTLELAIEPGLGAEGFRIVDGPSGSLLGPERFLAVYADGLETFGYRDSPLEATAYRLDNQFQRAVVFRVEQVVDRELKTMAGV